MNIYIYIIVYINFAHFVTSHLEMAALSPEVRRPVVRLTAHVLLVPRLRVGGALPPLSLRALGSVDCIVTGYGLNGPGIESLWRRDFPHLSRPALGPTQPPVQWILGFSGGKERPGRDADPSPPSSAVVMKG